MLARAVVVLVALAVVASAGAASPVPLHGARLSGPTGLQLVLPGQPPVVFDADAGTTTRVRGIPATRRVLRVVGVGGRGAVVALEGDWPNDVLYGIRGTRATRLGLGAAATPAGGNAVWIERFVDAGHCTLRKVALDGRTLRRARPFPCGTASDPPGGRLGLVVRRTRVVDPATARTVARTRHGILAVAGTKLVLAGPGRRTTVRDPASGRDRTVRWPSVLDGRDTPAVDPTGRYVVLAFADPAWQSGGRQALDLWLLDTANAKLTQVPSMPAFVLLKETSIAWTRDGRLVLLAGTDAGDLVGVWRPGEPELAVKKVALPERDCSATDEFAVVG
jgi:hypothetical protein